tara:strand:- start:1084 stop:1251 length:168 start_codon:yes stop_codon:yes gene_type:complete
MAVGSVMTPVKGLEWHRQPQRLRALDIFMIKCCTSIEFTPYCVAEGLKKPRKQQG